MPGKWFRSPSNNTKANDSSGPPVAATYPDRQGDAKPAIHSRGAVSGEGRRFEIKGTLQDSA